MPGYISRDVYLQKLINSREDGAAKVVTGPRRCGKSWLLSRLYKDYLIADLRNGTLSRAMLAGNHWQI